MGGTPIPVVATGLLRVSVPPDDAGNHVRMLDLLQRRNAPNELNARAEVACLVMCPLAGATPIHGAMQLITRSMLLGDAPDSVDSCGLTPGSTMLMHMLSHGEARTVAALPTFVTHHAGAPRCWQRLTNISFSEREGCGE